MPPKKPRQGRLSFTPKSASTPPAGSAASRQSSSSRGGRGGSVTAGKRQKRRAPNASILNFFQKVPRNSGDDGGLFMEGEYDDEDDGHGDAGDGVYGEEEEEDDFESEELSGLFEEKPVADNSKNNQLPAPRQQNKKPVKGPFTIDEDDSSDESSTKNDGPIPSSPHPVNFTNPSIKPDLPLGEERPLKRKLPFSIDQDDEGSGDEQKPTLSHQQPNLDQEEDFKDEELFEDGDADDFEIDSHGFQQREENRYLEMLQEQQSVKIQTSEAVMVDGSDVIKSEETVSCPICGMNLASLMEDEANRHVNQCLDEGDGPSNPIPTIPQTPSHPSSAMQTPLEANSSSFNSFTPGPSISSSSILKKHTAFTQIMTNHTEKAAWNAAEAAEAASRGKPASQRTCPFYKILFNGTVSMDAFKYGKIPGVTAYFLSHFHSDHYGGLTASWTHGLIWCTRVTANLVRQKLGVDPRWVREVEFERESFVDGGIILGAAGNFKPGGGGEGLWVTAIPANHCPGSAIFVFERRGVGGKSLEKVLHCGDFRAAPWMLKHRLLTPWIEYIDEKDGKQKRKEQWVDTIYLDTTYLSPKYAFPSQKDVISACSELCVGLNSGDGSWNMGGKVREGKGKSGMMGGLGNMVTNFVKQEDNDNKKKQEKLLVVVGTYSIGKERICMGIARALDSKIYAPPHKQKICACLEDPELNSRLTSNPLDAQVHMTPLMEIRVETLLDYLQPYKPHFTRIIGLRPSGWSYKPPTSRSTDSPTVSTILHSPTWHSPYTPHDLVPARGSTREAACFGVPYSEHSSFRELTMFVCGLNVRKVIPTVNVGSAKSRERMGAWIGKWEGEKRRKGLFKWETGGAEGCGGGAQGEWGGL
ncbi:putative DNA repair protein Pso2/Snm1 [Peziza echinospora]|nr:putative DNA repair protein Pso2/Snm1 [Peziza echinospora]